MRTNFMRHALRVFALCLQAEAQQPKKVPRIGYLSRAIQRLSSARSEGNWAALRERGYMEGQNITTEYNCRGEARLVPELAADECISRLISLCTGRDIPVPVQECDQDDSHRYGGPRARPVEAGLVESLARPGVTSLALQILAQS